MALHLQQQILDELQALIADGGTGADPVSTDRIDPLAKGFSKAVLIEEGDAGDDVEPGSIKALQARSLQVLTRCVVKAHATAAADARALGLQVEKLVSTGSAALRGLCKGGWRLTNSRQAPRGDGEELVVERILTWQFDYFVLKTTPDVVA